MIDNYETAIALTNKIKASLPFRVQATKRSLKTFQDKQPNVTIKDWFTVTSALYTGDEGGIILGLKPFGDGKSAVLISITHLVIDPEYEFAEEIQQYQQERVGRLAMVNGQGFAAEVLAGKNKIRRPKRKGFG